MVPAAAAYGSRLLLWATYELALQRVADDPTRGLSADPEFLRETHVRFREMANRIPTPDWEIDTKTVSPQEIAADVVAEIVSTTEPRHSLFFRQPRPRTRW